MRHTANLERVEQRVASWPAVVLVWQGLAVSLALSTFLSTTKASDLLQAQENLLAANDQVWETARKWSVVCLLTIVVARAVPIPVIRTDINSFCRWFHETNTNCVLPKYISNIQRRSNILKGCLRLCKKPWVLFRQLPDRRGWRLLLRHAQLWQNVPGTDLERDRTHLHCFVLFRVLVCGGGHPIIRFQFTSF